MNKEKIATISHFFVAILAGILLAFVGIKYVLPIILPFILAWGIAFAVRRPADFIARKTKISKKILRPLVAILLILSLIGGIVYLIIRVASEAWQLFSSLAEGGKLVNIISSLLNPFDNLFADSGIAPELEQKLVSAVSGLLSELLSSSAGVLTAVASSIPKILLFILVTSISAIYFSIDLEHVNNAIRAILPKRINSAISGFKKTSLSVLLRYMRSYLLIMLLTFAIMIFGLTLLRVRYALLLAIIIALLDLLPIIGVGTVLIPWSAWMFITGDIKMGIGLLVLFAVSEIARQIAEPKIFGTNLGIHPLLTLVLMYVGYSVFGIFGLLVIPAFSIIISVLLAKSKTSEVG